MPTASSWTTSPAQSAGLSARYDADYVVALPGGGSARSNPVIKPVGCRRAALERPVIGRPFTGGLAADRVR